MLEIVPSNQFKKELKSAKKRGYKMECLKEVVDTLEFFLFQTGMHSDLF